MKVPIAKLSPAEPVLEKEVVDKYRNRIAVGESLDPIAVTEITDRFIVRDGNHRVRALIEHQGAAADCAISIDAMLNGTEPPDWILEIAHYFGVGYEAFRAVPMVYRADRHNKTIEMNKHILDARRSS